MAIRASLTIDILIDDDDFTDFSDSFYESIHYEVYDEVWRERWKTFHGEYKVKPIKMETYSHDSYEIHHITLKADNDD